MLYGLFIDDLFPLAITTLIGQIMALVYITSFAWISKEHAYVVRTCAIGAVPILFITLYAVLAWQGVTHQSFHSIGLVLGYIGVGTSLIFYGSPLIKIRTVLQTKSAACIPVDLNIMGAINNVLWVIYSIVTSDVFIFIPNMGCFILASLQIMLYFRFHPNKAAAATTVDTLENNIVVCIVAPRAHDEVKSPSFQALHSPVAEKRV